jgi:hypothetical protein
MIVSIDEDEKEVRTDGCSCCSCTYSIEFDKQEILENLVDQEVVLRRTLKLLKVSRKEFELLLRGVV